MVATISSYSQANQLLDVIQECKRCVGECKHAWLRNLRYALSSSTNPLQLSSSQREHLTRRVRHVGQTRCLTHRSHRKRSVSRSGIQGKLQMFLNRAKATRTRSRGRSRSRTRTRGHTYKRTIANAHAPAAAASGFFARSKTALPKRRVAARRRRTATKTISRLNSYLYRKAPPYRAAEYPGETKRGNDGNMYISKRGPDGIYKWKQVTKKERGLVFW